MKQPKRLAVLGAALAVAVASGAAVAWAGPERGPHLTRADQAVAQLAPPVYQPESELQFVPLDPCQVVNTKRTGHKLGTNATKTYAVTGTAGFGAQGGHSAGCAVPASATAATFTLLAGGATKAGTVRVSSGDTTPTMAALAYQAKQQTTGAVTSKLGAATGTIKATNVGRPTDLTIVVTGYYDKPLAGFVSPTGSPYSGSSRMIGGAHPGTGVYEVQFDRNIRYCSATATPYVSSYYASASTWFDSARPDTVRVNVWNADGAAVDQYFYIRVDC
jgi:hypothetical protein